MNPDSEVAHNNLGSTLANLGEHEEAIQSYNKALELGPGDLEVVNKRDAAMRKLDGC